MEGGLGDFGTVTSQLATQARLLAEQAMGAPGGFGGPGGLGIEGEPAELGAVRVARELGKLSQAALRLAVERAQSGGHSWEEIGERLGVSPQAAYQRFGRSPALSTGAREEPVVTDAADRAVSVLAAWFEEHYDIVSASFDDAMVKTFPLEGLAAARAQAVASAGPYQRLGDQDPIVRQAGDYTVADVPLLFETGLMKGRVCFDRDARVVGLYVLPPATP
jgi:hypothetical protein